MKWLGKIHPVTESNDVHWIEQLERLQCECEKFGLLGPLGEGIGSNTSILGLVRQI